jgi:hypothetical protein
MLSKPLNEYSITELREIVQIACTSVGSIEGEALLAISERITRIEEVLFQASRKITSNQSVAAKVEKIFDEAKRTDPPKEE